MDPWTILPALLLIAAANSAPVLGKKVFGARFAHPLDGGRVFIDGKRWLGDSKTLRGIVLAFAASLACAAVLALPAEAGLKAAFGAMAGDLLSSFIKRRLDRPSSSRATGLDQVPESLIPAILLRGDLGLGLMEIAVTVSVFFIGEILLSRILFRWHIRDEPY